MLTDSLVETVANEKLQVFALYVDFEASGHARRVAGTVTRLAATHRRASSQTWKLDTLTTSGPIKKMVTFDAANADVLVVAVSSLAQRPLDLIGWLDSLAALKPDPGAHGLLIGLLGDEEDDSQELNWTVNQLIRCAQQTNRNFIWHWMGQGATDDLSWLTENGEMLLARKQSQDEQIILQGTAIVVD